MLISGGEVVLSDSTPAYARSSYFNQSGIGLTHLFATYAALYRGNFIVQTVVSKLAKATARLPLKVFERSASGDRDESRDTPFAELIRRPNPRHDPHFMWLWTASTFDIYGEAMWYKIRGRDGVPVEVWPLHPTNVTVRNVGGNIEYVWAAGQTGVAGGLVFPAEDVVHFRSFNPDTTLRGLSSLEALRLTLLNEDAARRANAAFWNNGMRPSVHLSHPGNLSDGAMERLESQVNVKHGGVDNFGKTLILEEGMTPHVLSLDIEEAQYIESRKLNREEVCMAYDVPPPVIHILDHATYSNITEQMRSMYRDTMAPKLGLYESVIDHQLRPDFDPDGQQYAEFLMDEVMRGTLEERSAAIQASINSAQLTPNEGRALDNRPPMPGGDRLFINATMIPIEEVSQHTAPVAPAMTPPETPADLPPEPAPVEPGEKTLTADVLRSVMGRLGRVADLASADVKTLTHGLNGSAALVADELAVAIAAGWSVDDFKARLRALAMEAA